MSIIKSYIKLIETKSLSPNIMFALLRKSKKNGSGNGSVTDAIIETNLLSSKELLELLEINKHSYLTVEQIINTEKISSKELLETLKIINDCPTVLLFEKKIDWEELSLEQLLKALNENDNNKYALQIIVKRIDWDKLSPNQLSEVLNRNDGNQQMALGIARKATFSEMHIPGIMKMGKYCEEVSQAILEKLQ